MVVEVGDDEEEVWVEDDLTPYNIINCVCVLVPI